jgi:flagellar hook-basal body complex protein FliE
MSAIEPIASAAAEQLSAALFATDEVGPQAAPISSGASFGQLMAQGLEKANDQLLTSQADLQALAAGEVQNLHEVMIRLEESRITFQLLMQARGRLLEAYQDVMKMQV